VAIARQLTLCRRLYLLRKQSGYTQTDVAERLYISQSAYSRLENGSVDITFNALGDIADLYRMPISKLVEDL
jgi:transcriptional regulator with XRE-family HTH domain